MLVPGSRLASADATMARIFAVRATLSSSRYPPGGSLLHVLPPAGRPDASRRNRSHRYPRRSAAV